MAELSKAVVERSFITIIGASGSGKSSLLGAGLAATLRSGRVEQFEGWEIVSLSPTVHPRETLASAVERCVTSGSSPHRGLIVLLDQLEELFTLADPSERDALIAGLVALIGDATVPTRIIATLRADHCTPSTEPSHSGPPTLRTPASAPSSSEAAPLSPFTQRHRSSVPWYGET